MERMSWSIVVSLLLAFSRVSQGADCTGLQDNERFDCYPDEGSNEQGCLSRGCCWQLPTVAATGDINIPYCFFPRDFPSYRIASVPQNDSGVTKAVLVRDQASGRPADIKSLQLTVSHESTSRLRVRIEAQGQRRWEPPIPLGEPRVVEGAESDFLVSLRSQPFGLKVERKSDGTVLLDSASVAAPLIFADQFLQLSSRLPNARVFGIGEQRRNFSHDMTGWQRIALWSRDQPPIPHVNLYGVHNFLLGLLPSGGAFGIFMLNSNAQEVLLQPLPAITYRSIGGIFDLFLLSGTSPAAVVSQYYALVGLPMLPPMWALGFHLSRYGFKSSTDTNNTLQRNLGADMPLDVLWNDIDYMDGYKDWTIDEQNFGQLPQLVKEVHARRMRYVMIVDPAISNTHYPAYDSGVASQVFIKDVNGQPIVGKVWPGTTAFPDFTAPQTVDWWSNQASGFRTKIPFDGMWIDMNEPSSFVAGSLSGCPNGNPLDFPPYTPWVLGHSLIEKTICSSAQQNLSSHYNLHSMYGYFEAKVTHAVMKKLDPTKRPFILSRSTFAGSGRYTFHWTGDNTANWDNIRASIPQVLNFNLFAIPMVGADICGFLGDTNEELCTRWMQLGSLYPFMRNHNTKGARDQDPAVWSPTAQAAMREALHLRYSLLPYLYTQLYIASSIGLPVARPLFLEFPEDAATHTIDQQFLLGPALLVSPVLTPGAVQVSAYLPDARWCDVRTGIGLSSRAKHVSLAAPLKHINVHLRGGHLLLTKPPAANTAAQRGSPYGLRACLDDKGFAAGQLFADDGETVLEKGAINLVAFYINEATLVTTPIASSGGPARLGSLWVSGVVGSAPANVSVNRVPVRFQFDSANRILNVTDIDADLLRPITVSWK